ncbi:hypothetical protein FVE85_8896 [Porphyridium purpureum]|uniref:Uncharacterized protein n=1 Tax=Porphyridium purpureum TaxID=35688 RepID=A0A5J4YPK4_PORPP|nr:hypothetical protein FVE85_8896 [Porphyridium purpureum]|eukprot:POR4069..scf296_7
MQAHKREHARMVDRGELARSDGMRFMEYGLFSSTMSVLMVGRVISGAIEETISDRVEVRGGTVEGDVHSALYAGATSYCFEEQAGSDNVLSIILRIEWSIGGAKERYIHYQPVRYQHVPFQNVLVAQIIFYRRWLEGLLPTPHALFKSSLFSPASHSMMNALDSALVGGSRTTLRKSIYEASGVPVSTILLTLLSELAETRWETVDAMQSFISDKLAGLVLPESNVSNLSLDAKLKDFGEERRTYIAEQVQQLQVTGALSQHERPGRSGPAFSPNVYLCGSRFHRVPEDLVLAKGISLREAWRLWWCGTHELRVCAYRLLRCSEMPTTSTRNRFSEWRMVLHALSKKLKEKGIDLFDVDAVKANELYEKMMALGLVPASMIQLGRKRLRASDRTISTIYRLIRLGTARSGIAENAGPTETR